MVGCAKVKICLNYQHDNNCVIADECNVRMTCYSVVNGRECLVRDRGCPYDHEDEDVRRRLYEHRHASH
ncbi:uncharacterized protein BDZ99DRAFT_110306 [Mytilinidion resinicola]|uniref:Uncharacterized protein n=1 Tax=Mytilinidion resinicola TaxID=574789 RepID=A0A6A6YA76_9PEZI|nr:uncharacterized protein BDZ99DRAFT_110306 [Mytilinidion resinicola]KAF2805716.1 hypothetical protein BDZ99DRAFT_110306 [Mytilinidion resinicola]